MVQKYSMEPIEVDEGRSTEMFEVEVERTLRGYDVMSDRGPGAVVRTTNVRVTVPVVPSDTLRAIWKHELAPNTYSLVKYPEYEYDDRAGTISTVIPMEEAAVKDAVNKIRGAVDRYNSSIEGENQSFRSKIVTIVNSKRGRVTEKHSKLDTLAAAVGIPLTKKTDPSRVVVATPRVRQKIAPVMPQYRPGQAKWIAGIRSRSQRHPGLFFAGSTLGAFGLPDCTQSGEDAASAAFAFLSSAKRVPSMAGEN